MQNDKLYWIELCGFDRTQPDFGIDKILSDIPQNVTGFVILFANIEFYNSFCPSAGEYYLSIDDCVYGGRRRYGEDDSFRWTNFQLKRLIALLHARHIKVYATVFDSMETIVPGSFSAAHNEIAQLMNDFSRNPCVDPTAELADGRDYGAYLIQKVCEALVYYGFDGAHYADGISSWRIPLQTGDFSDKRLAQFAEYLKDDAKKEAVGKIMSEKAELGKTARDRSRKIWNRFREEWIGFCAARWADFFNRLCREVRAVGKENIANIAWVRDPFEALYRYGLDYSLIDISLLSAVIVNDVNRKIVPESDSCGFKISKDEFKYSNHDGVPVMMLTKAKLRGVKQYAMVPIRDNCEHWDALSDCPNSFKAKVYRRNNCFYFDGSYKRINEGILYCLSTGVSAEEWRFIAQTERDSVLQDARPLGFCLLYSDAAAKKEVGNYVQARKPSAFWQLKELQIAGLPVYTVTNFEYLDRIDMPVLCLNTEDYSEEEKAALKKYLKPIVAFGEAPVFPDKQCIEIRCKNNANCYIYNIGRGGLYDVSDKNAFGCKRKRMMEAAAGIWIKYLGYRKISRSENRRLVAALHHLFGGCRAKKDILLNLVQADGNTVALADNPNDYAVVAEIAGDKRHFVEIEANGVSECIVEIT